MKGLALLLSKGPPPKGGGPMPDDKAPPMADEESPDSESGGDAREYARHFVEAMKDGDDAGAIEALVSLHDCK